MHFCETSTYFLVSAYSEFTSSESDDEDTSMMGDSSVPLIPLNKDSPNLQQRGGQPSAAKSVSPFLAPKKTEKKASDDEMPIRQPVRFVII